MAPSETPLEMVRRHVSEAEAHIARQVQIVERLRTSPGSAPEAAELLTQAEALLVQLRSAQAAHLAHLRQIQNEQDAGWRDADGNLHLA